MNALMERADWSVVDNSQRGDQIKRRRLRMGIKSARAFHEASGIDRVAIAKAERGEGSEQTYARIEAWLDDKEHEMSSEADEALADPSSLVTIKMSGVYGIDDVTISGPVDNLADLKKLAVDLIRDVRERAEAAEDDQ